MATPPLAVLSKVSSTALLTALGRAASRDADPWTREVAQQLRPLLRQSGVRFHNALGRRPPRRGLARYLSARAAHFDSAARDFVARNPGGVVVNMACGLDTRFFRLGEQIPVIDVDVPSMIALKRALLPARPGHTLVAGSVLEPEWLAAVPTDRPVIFLAEGLLMYLPEDRVRQLLRTLAARHPGSELVAEVFQRRWLSGPMGALTRLRLRRLLGGASFQFGVASSDAMAAWGPLVYLGDWSPLDALGPVVRRAPWLRESMWVVRYRLGAAR